MEKIVVTRHVALLQYLIDNKYVEPDVKHISHAIVDDIRGKHVYGILPNWLACHAGKLTELQLRLPIEKRGVELTLKEIGFYIVTPKTYIIKEVENGKDT
jgi:hypothetical protein